MIIDIIAGLLIAFGFYQGFSSGLIKTVFASISLLIGIIAAMKLSDTVMEILERTFGLNQAISFVLGFVITFIVVMLLIRFIGGKLDNLFKNLQLGIVNKLAGGILLSLFYAILVSYGVFVMDKISLVSDNVKTSSISYPLLEPLPRATQDVGKALQPMFSDFWDKLLETMDSVDKKAEELIEE